MNVFVLAILFYLLYRFIGGFLIPLFRTTRHMRQQFHNMNGGANMNGGTKGGQTGNPPHPPPPGDSGIPPQPGPSGTGTPKVGEYIDFEEIK